MIKNHTIKMGKKQMKFLVKYKLSAFQNKGISPVFLSGITKYILIIKKKIEPTNLTTNTTNEPEQLGSL